MFAASVPHNLVHLAIGVAGLLMAGTARKTTIHLIGGGMIYLALWLFGIAIDHNSTANFVPLNTAGNRVSRRAGLTVVGIDGGSGKAFAGATHRVVSAARA
ncbi:uncharacterized protein DUF4383 [Lentzea flaviverrucosa]|uniref:DUF4383 domain-containing protein n=1 Tax=Lentzea flaviverrucosa TaxID=200379 RepID=A0A1H9XRV3_9PSEU|nr:uncharacterized protein DUF4383 [Lentzea flaviverrucosa]SES48886.1 protein of unknown function [Lentzea flaviverrucosa]